MKRKSEDSSLERFRGAPKPKTKDLGLPNTNRQSNFKYLFTHAFFSHAVEKPPHSMKLSTTDILKFRQIIFNDVSKFLFSLSVWRCPDFQERKKHEYNSKQHLCM
jgi:hypothetical protein